MAKLNEEEQYNVETSYTSPALNAAESLDQQIDQAEQARQVDQQRYNKQSAVYETKWIINRYTANRVAADLLRSKAYPKRTIQFMADVHFGYLQVGDLISLTSSTLFLSHTISIITGKTWAQAGWQLTILIEDSTILTDRYYE